MNVSKINDLLCFDLQPWVANLNLFPFKQQTNVCKFLGPPMAVAEVPAKALPVAANHPIYHLQFIEIKYAVPEMWKIQGIYDDLHRFMHPIYHQQFIEIKYTLPHL